LEDALIYEPFTLTRYPELVPFSNRTEAKRRPALELLYIQKERVVVGTFEKVVSIRTVSVSNVSTADGDVVKLSSSMQEVKKTIATRTIARNKFLFFIFT
jgi:hypothetical protein